MANAGGLDFDENFARFRALKIHFNDFKWFARLKGHRCTRLHETSR
jgi:hypothetical protein